MFCAEFLANSSRNPAAQEMACTLLQQGKCAANDLARADIEEQDSVRGSKPRLRVAMLQAVCSNFQKPKSPGRCRGF
jgi:hypothetical protein